MAAKHGAQRVAEHAVDREENHESENDEGEQRRYPADGIGPVERSGPSLEAKRHAADTHVAGHALLQIEIHGRR